MGNMIIRTGALTKYSPPTKCVCLFNLFVFHSVVQYMHMEHR